MCVYLFKFMSVCLSVRLSVFYFIRPFVCLSVSACVSVSVTQTKCPAFFLYFQQYFSLLLRRIGILSVSKLAMMALP